MTESQLKEYPNAFISIDSTETPLETLAGRGFNANDYAYQSIHSDINTFLDSNDLRS
jgi:hypothetical protein